MPQYTKEDMKKLAEMSKKGSVPDTFLPGMDYDPMIYKELLLGAACKEDIHYIYEVELTEVPLLINDGHISGILKWRLAIGK